MKADGVALYRSGAPGAPDDIVLRVEGLTVAARSETGLVPLVEDLSFDLRRGETLAIAGESGSGKSITSLAIMGLLPQPAVRAVSGRVMLGETDLLREPESRMRGLRGDRVAMIFQEPMTSLNPIMTIGRQLTEALDAHATLSRKEAGIRAVEALEAVRMTEPARRMKQYPHELSGGMRQRVMIAMALALRPDVLIADEPTTALDVTVQREVLDLLRDLQRETGTALILITHDMGVVAEMADRVVVMRGGRGVEDGPVARIFDAPADPYTRALLDAVPRMGTGDGFRTTSVAAPVVASINNLSVAFDLRSGVLNRVTHRVHAVSDVSFEIRAGETMALVGESGCGKSTIARALVGLVPFSGEVRINGHDPASRGRAAQSLRRDVQMVFQDPMASLDPRMRVGEMVAEPLLIHGIGTAVERRARAVSLFERVGLTRDQLDRYPHEFSGGQRQRICIARALALNPKLIIADESVSALDVSVQAQVLDLLRELQAEKGMAYLFISHDMAVVENLADRVIVMRTGRIVESGTRAQIFGGARHGYTKRLIAAVPVPDPHHRRPPTAPSEIMSASPVLPVGDKPESIRLHDIGTGHRSAADTADWSP